MDNSFFVRWGKRTEPRKRRAKDVVSCGKVNLTLRHGTTFGAPRKLTHICSAVFDIHPLCPRHRELWETVCKQTNCLFDLVFFRKGRVGLFLRHHKREGAALDCLI